MRIEIRDLNDAEGIKLSRGVSETVEVQNVSEAIRSAAKKCGDVAALYKKKRFTFSGLCVDPLTENEIISCFIEAVETDDRLVLANLNLHGAYCALKSDAMRELHNARSTLVHIDGMPIVWIGNWHGQKLTRDTRNTHLDFMPRLLQICAARGWRVAFVGSAPGLENENELALSRIAPGIQVLCLNGFFDATHVGVGTPSEFVTQAINRFAPKLLIVGMGMPKQEEWIAAIEQKVSAPVIMPVGGYLDYIANRSKAAPRALGRLGLEWAWRLLADPRRLAYRYLVEPIYMVALISRAKD